MNRPPRGGIFLVALIAWFALASADPLRAGPADKRLDLYWIDTEGGAATLIVTPAGESVLIDSGNPGDRDAGRIFKAAQAAGLKRIDYLITTHYHVDHFGGAAPLSALIPIGTVYDNGQFEGGTERPTPAYLDFKADRRAVLSAGDVLPLKQAEGSAAVQLKCLAARKQFVAPSAGAAQNPLCADARRQPDDPTDNANSIVTLLSFGPFRLYVGGDLTWNMEANLVCPVNLVGTVDVYQVTHHGLDISNNAVLVRSLAPTVAVMGNGPTKGCGPVTWATLRKTESVQAVYQLHRNVRPDGKVNNTAAECIANAEAEGQACAGNDVRLSVEPSGKSYTVSIPANKHERTFQSKGEERPAGGSR